MKGPDGFVQAYNAQVAVNEDQLIMGQAVTQATNDKQQVMPMITTIEEQSGITPTQLLADAAIARTRTWPRWPTRPSTPTFRRANRNMANGPDRVHEVRCRQPRHESTVCRASCTRRPAQRSTRTRGCPTRRSRGTGDRRCLRPESAWHPARATRRRAAARTPCRSGSRMC